MNWPILAMALALVLPSADDPIDWRAGFESGGAAVSVRVTQRQRRPASVAKPSGTSGSRGNAATAAASGPVVRYERRTAVVCPLSGIGGADESCAYAEDYCARFSTGGGPLTQVWQREVTQPAQPGAWLSQGTTCFPTGGVGATAGGAAQPGVTAEMIRAAWARLPFAKAGVVMQPPGGETLVQLPTYYRVDWPGTGVTPGQVSVVPLVGQQVRIRPTLVSFRYDFGDGSAPLVTTSPGGSFPNGDVRHTYKRAVRVLVRIDVVYGGEFSLNGGPWTRINDQLTITGSPTPLEVRTAENRLIPNS